jgi:hypothetical protein
MSRGLPSVAPLRGSLQRFRRYLDVAFQDHLGADVFDELIRHVDEVLLDLERFGARQNDSTRALVRAIGDLMEGSNRTGVFESDGDLGREAKVLMPLLTSYLESLRVGGAA